MLTGEASNDSSRTEQALLVDNSSAAVGAGLRRNSLNFLHGLELAIHQLQPRINAVSLLQRVATRSHAPRHGAPRHLRGVEAVAIGTGIHAGALRAFGGILLILGLTHAGLYPDLVGASGEHADGQ